MEESENQDQAILKLALAWKFPRIAYKVLVKPVLISTTVSALF